MGLKFNPLIFSGLDFTGSGSSAPTIGSPVIGADPNSVLIVDNAGNLADVPLTDGQIVVGSTGSEPVAATITGTSNQLIVTNGPGSITLSLPQDIDPTSDVTFNSVTLTTPLDVLSGGTGFSAAPGAGEMLIGNASGGYNLGNITGTANQIDVTSGDGTVVVSAAQDIATTSSPTFANLSLTPSASIDLTSTGTLAIGTSNANIINIGNSGATINIQGNTFYQNVTDLNVADKNITINHGGSVGSASNAGLQVEEGGSITGYTETSSDRNSWQFLAPNTAGIVTITPGASGFTINQGSHNPVTLGTASGLSISTQVLSLAVSSASQTGALSSTDWSTFNGKQNAGNYITDLTGDITASGPGSVAAILATVNSTAGTFGSASHSSVFTLNVKGLITAATDVSIQIAESQVTGLVTDLSNKVDKVTGDIVPTTFSGLVNNTASQNIIGLSFATTVSSFEAFLNIQIVATANTYTTIKILGTRKAPSNWSIADIEPEFTGDSIPGLAFGITSAGQVQISVGSTTGFASGTIKFRAMALS